MKGLIAFVVFSFVLLKVQSSPLDRIEVDIPAVSDYDRERVQDGVEKLVKFAKLLQELELEIPRLKNVISAPIYCEEGYKYDLGKCRKVLSTVPGQIRQPPPRY